MGLGQKREQGCKLAERINNLYSITYMVRLISEIRLILEAALLLPVTRKCASSYCDRRTLISRRLEEIA